MEAFELQEMSKGWFVGRFAPTVYSTDACEVAVKHYKQGDYEEEHYHKIATEITVVISGHVRMCGREWYTGSIILLLPMESTDFEVLEDTITAVVKLPGALHDKYVGSP